MGNEKTENTPQQSEVGFERGVSLPNIGDKIRVWDSCFQRDLIERVTRIVKSISCGTIYIYSERMDWNGGDERLSTPENIKEIIRST